MADFPAFCYQQSGYGYSFSPVSVRTIFNSNNTRQRSLFGGEDDIFTVKLRLDSDELATFESFVSDTLNNGADTFTGPFYVSDVEEFGTMEIVGGNYSVAYLTVDYWEVSYSFALKDRDLTDAGNLYELVLALSGFDQLDALILATENAINYNYL